MKATIIGMATAKGSVRISAEETAEKFKRPVPKVLRCGPKMLHRFAHNESVSAMMAEAAENAMDSAGIKAKEIDGIYASSCGPDADYIMPGLASIVRVVLGMRGSTIREIPAKTNSMGCAGGMHALEDAFNHLAKDSLTGKTRTYLVLAGSHVSRYLDKDNWETAPLFSEGAAALLLSTRNDNGPYTLERIESTNLTGPIMALRISNPNASQNSGPARLKMDGREVYEFAVKALPIALQLLGLQKFPEDCYALPHQASWPILSRMQSEFRLKDDQIYKDGLLTIGNMLGASPFFGLEDVIRRNLAGNKDIIMFGFGAELAVSAAYLKRNVPAEKS